MTKPFIPQLLCPAGNMEKLKVAISYGADAVYLAGQHYGLRSAADNFTPDELKEAVSFAHDRGVKVYVALNSFFHDKDFVGLDDYLVFLESLGVDALIVSDEGVVLRASLQTQIPIHLSTQASCLNQYSALFWKQMGVKRIVLGREVSLEDAARIKKETGLEVELFIHGSMCMSYSGHCIISNFTQGRDSNRGGCAHSCRFEYTLKTDEGAHKTAYFMSSKDLRGLELLNLYSKFEIDSIKIEGRMKSHLYLSTVTSCYAQALKNLEDPLKLASLSKELEKTSHKEFTFGSLLTPADEASIYDKRESENQTFHLIGIVQDVFEDSFILETRTGINNLWDLEILKSDGTSEKIDPSTMTDLYGNRHEKSRPGQLVRFPKTFYLERYHIMRGSKKDETCFKSS